MKVLLAGATGAIGIPLTRRLLAHGHEVLGLTRDRVGADRLVSLGATPVVANALDRADLLRAIDGLSADAVIHELTALRKMPRQFSEMATTNRLRTEGTANLLAAAARLGAERFVTQSMILGYGYRDHGSSVLNESDAFGIPSGDRSDATVVAMGATEQQAFTAPIGIALRYGLFYGGDVEAMRALLSRRRIPVVHGGLLGWIHHDDAAAATVAALERGIAGHTYNVVDDQPASFETVVTAMADALGVRDPRRVPRWLLRLAAPLMASIAVDTSMIVSNARAKRELGWTPMYPTYHEGVTALASDRRGGPATLTDRSDAA